MAGIVVKGEYKGKAVGLSVSGKKAYIFTKRFSLNKNTWLELNSDSVESYEVLNEENKSGMLGSAVKESVFGTAAAMNTNKNKVIVAIKFKDGKKSLIECDKPTLKAIQIGCF